MTKGKKKTLEDRKYLTFKMLFLYSLCCSSSGCWYPLSSNTSEIIWMKFLAWLRWVLDILEDRERLRRIRFSLKKKKKKKKEKSIIRIWFDIGPGAYSTLNYLTLRLMNIWVMLLWIQECVHAFFPFRNTGSWTVQCRPRLFCWWNRLLPHLGENSK